MWPISEIKNEKEKKKKRGVKQANPPYSLIETTINQTAYPNLLNIN